MAVDEAAKENKLKASVIELFKANAGVILGFGEIVSRLNLPDEERGSLRVLLGGMVDSEMIRRRGSGRFLWPIVPTTNTELEELLP